MSKENAGLSRRELNYSDKTYKAFKHSESVLKIFEELWEQRIDLVFSFYKKKKSFRGLIFKNSLELQEAFAHLKQELLVINNKEQKIVTLIKSGVSECVVLLENVSSDIDNLQTPTFINSDVALEVKKSAGLMIPIVKKYSELTIVQQYILDLERALLDNPTDENWKLYILRIEFFTTEFKKLMDEMQMVATKRQQLKDLYTSIEKIKNLDPKKSPTSYVAPSTVSAFFRVSSTNLASGFILGNPLTNPYFWKLSAIIFVLVIAVNFIDYYFNVFTTMTNKVNKLLKLAK